MLKQISSADSKKLQKRKFWQDHVKAWKGSGLSQAEYCRKQELKAHKLCYWVNKKSAKSDRPLALVEVPTQKIPVYSGAPLKLSIDDRYQVEIADHFSQTTLEQVLQILRRIA